MAAVDAEGRTAAVLLAMRGVQERNMQELLVNSAFWTAAAVDHIFAVSCTSSCQWCMAMHSNGA